MRTKLLLSALAGGLLAFWQLPQTAAAHVLLTDTTDRYGAVLHVTPNDDPVAGKPSTLYFDVQAAGVGAETHAYAFTVAQAGAREIVPVDVSGTIAAVTYAFPSQGLYDLRLQLTPKNNAKPIVFTYAQRVSRGEGVTIAPGPPLWAEAGVLAAGCGLAVLVIVAFNRKRRIMHYSRFKK